MKTTRMRNLIIAILALCPLLTLAQSQEEKPRKSMIKTTEDKAKEAARKAPISWYKIYTLEKDTSVVDTTLSIKKYYQFNYLRKDRFGQLQYPNEGQTFSYLDYSLQKNSIFPEMGFKAKHYGFMESDDIRYYHVPTPLSDIYFKTVMEQGQSVDALVAINTSKNVNISVAFKGLRSLGKYINQLSSTGNFRWTTSYRMPSGRYSLNAHFTGQDFLNGENGGLTTVSDFEGGESIYNNRARLQVYLTDALTVLKSKRLFFDHALRMNTKDNQNNLYLLHRFNYEHKYFEFNQATLATTLVGTSTSTTFNRFGDAGATTKINDQLSYDKLYNRVGIQFENKTLGMLRGFLENYNYFYNFPGQKTIGTVEIPGQLKASIATIGGEYEYRKGAWNGIASLTNSFTAQSLRNFEIKARYTLNEKNNFVFQYQNQSKLPNNNFILNQSSYTNYNWYNSFKNEKFNTLKAEANTQWLHASLQLSTISDYLYFQDTQNVANQQLVTPHQFAESINYLAVKADREFKFRSFGWDITALYQKVDQSKPVLNVPELTLRSSLFYSNYWFKRAMFVQTGATVNYFSKFYANDYNPVIGEYFVQTQKQIGNFPVVDVFFNARVRQTRIFFVAEHVNSLFGKNNYYASPSMPYRDFIIRFGFVWNFFQ
ncbi:MAG: hypothetical protein RL607_1377 [Bacteroidota bacterium]|jgi:hypothetical protein